jgi:hypothetical protein
MFLHRCPVSECVSQISFRCVKINRMSCSLRACCGLWEGLGELRGEWMSVDVELLSLVMRF